MSFQFAQSSVTDEQRRRALRRHKAGVTALLILAAVIFLGCSWWQSQGPVPGWVGYVRAAAEAGMVGGLADWFAVTALFRHPLGLPIPHTALVPKKKDQLGDSLSGFVGENFLNPQLITEKVAQAEIPQRVGGWLAQPDNARTVSREVGTFTERAITAMDDDEAAALIQTHIVGRFAEPEWGPPAGTMLESLIRDGKTEPLIDSAITWAKERIYRSEFTIVNAIDERMPTWAPQFARELVGARVYREIVSFVEDVEADPQHEARESLRRFIAQLAQDLQSDPTMIARVEEIKSDIMGSAAVRQAGGTLWRAASEALVDAARDPESVLRRKVTEIAQEWGERIQTDEQLRASLDRRLTGAVRFLAENYSGEITAIISETVHQWDAEEASDKIELMVGKDLQFIRLNGTIVGALAGLAIYTVSTALFGA
ncbi:DUF445 domain-containing protein [Corynebacterium tapiri]|uniref:DUF445 family protein n=1 Tax=Corynebacterium tapiri TaxID=1448266 RepID=A0A5C4U4N9_9CORY|nr:DUF445 family protein [Corynebacterium tapiri]TNL97323.1 DUF445 family protein [Corynebacterium tapiri]